MSDSQSSVLDTESRKNSDQSDTWFLIAGLSTFTLLILWPLIAQYVIVDYPMLFGIETGDYGGLAYIILTLFIWFAMVSLFAMSGASIPDDASKSTNRLFHTLMIVPVVICLVTIPWQLTGFDRVSDRSECITYSDGCSTVTNDYTGR